MERSKRRAGSAPASYRTVVTADGRPGPIEQRLGRRLVRVVDPDTREGRRLLRCGDVEWIAPGGDALGPMTEEEALAALRRRLEARLADPGEDLEASAALDGLDRLRDRSNRVGRA